MRIQLVLLVLLNCVVLLILVGCSGSSLFGGPPPLAGQQPLVTATDRSATSLTVIACPVRPEGGLVVAEVLQSLTQQGPLVTASDRGNARLVINVCPSPPTAEMIRELARMRTPVSR